MANIALTASEIAASCAAVRRSAAIRAMLTSNVRRASNICVRVNPCSAASTLRGSLSSIGGPSATNVPEPWRMTMSPLAASA